MLASPRRTTGLLIAGVVVLSAALLGARRSQPITLVPLNTASGAPDYARYRWVGYCRHLASPPAIKPTLSQRHD